MLEIIITSSLLILLLILLRRLCRNRISRRLQYALWLLAAARLLLPFTLSANPFSIMNFLHPAAERMEEWAEGTKLSEIGNPGIHKSSEKDSPADSLPLDVSGTEKENSGSRTSEKAVQLSGTASHSWQVTVKTTDRRNASSRDIPGISFNLRELERMLEGRETGELSVRRLLKYGWYTGMAVMGLWMLGCNLLFHLKVMRKREFLGKEGKVRVYSSKEVGTPCLLGILYPAVYLTPDCARNQKHREYTLAHELTHYHHGDHVWTFIRNLTCCAS